MAIPPTMLIADMRRPAVASPFTYFTAPSMAPKKLDSSCILSRRLFASWASMAPVLRSASIAICLPGMASSVNLAVTSATRSEPLFMTMNWTMSSMAYTMIPIIRSPPPTNCPKVSTTLPGLPVVSISRVDEIFNDILKSVVKSSTVGKNDISSASFENIAEKSTENATAIFTASRMSSSQEGIGTIIITKAAST